MASRWSQTRESRTKGSEMGKPVGISLQQSEELRNRTKLQNKFRPKTQSKEQLQIAAAVAAFRVNLRLKSMAFSRTPSSRSQLESMNEPELYCLDCDISELPIPVKKHIVTAGIVQGHIYTYSDSFACIQLQEDSETTNRKPLMLHIQGPSQQSLTLAVGVVEKLLSEAVEPEKTQQPYLKLPPNKARDQLFKMEYEIKDLSHADISSILTKGIIQGEIHQVSGAVVSVRGSPYLPRPGSQFPPPQRLLYLYIQGPSHQSLIWAIKRIEQLKTEPNQDENSNEGTKTGQASPPDFQPDPKERVLPTNMEGALLGGGFPQERQSLTQVGTKTGQASPPDFQPDPKDRVRPTNMEGTLLGGGFLQERQSLTQGLGSELPLPMPAQSSPILPVMTPETSETPLLDVISQLQQIIQGSTGAGANEIQAQPSSGAMTPQVAAVLPNSTLQQPTTTVQQPMGNTQQQQQDTSFSDIIQQLQQFIQTNSEASGVQAQPDMVTSQPLAVGNPQQTIEAQQMVKINEMGNSLEVDRVLKPLDGADLKDGEEKHSSRQQIISAVFPHSKGRSSEEILSLLSKQNVDLFVKDWRIINRSDADEFVHLEISTNVASAEKFKKDGFKVNYLFGQVQLKVKNYRPAHAPKLAVPSAGRGIVAKDQCPPNQSQASSSTGPASATVARRGRKKRRRPRGGPLVESGREGKQPPRDGRASNPRKIQERDRRDRYIKRSPEPPRRPDRKYRWQRKSPNRRRD